MIKGMHIVYLICWKSFTLRNKEVYHNKLKFLWDEILMLKPIPMCIRDLQPPCQCEVLKKVRENVQSEQVLKIVK